MRRSRLISLLVVFSLLFTSVAYACSGLISMQMTSVPMPMDDSSVKRGPCSDHKQDICKSVRDRMLSVWTVSAFVTAIPHYELTGTSHPAMVEAGVAPMLRDRGPPSAKPAFHHVFKLQLPLSYLVLRL